MFARTRCAAAVLLLFAGCTTPDPAMPTDPTLDDIAEAYVQLVLHVGQHDEGYVDAYYGPDAWRQDVENAPKPLDAIEQDAEALLTTLEEMDVAGAEEIVRLRHQYLMKQLQSVIARTQMLGGADFSFDAEARLLYDAEPPQYDADHFQQILDELDARLPGEGALIDRYEAFKKDFVIPLARLDTVFNAAIAEARRRTAARIDLPDEENFELEYVTDKSWSGYNWYQGDAQSLIQINTDLPIYIDRAIDLAAHEGYPGHHVYNAMLEKSLVEGRGWVEFSVYPLFSPQSLIAEGSANYGIEVAFPEAERMAFEREVLFPLAGLDASRVDEYYAVEALVGTLSYAGNEAARAYLNGEMDADEAVEWLTTYALSPRDRARQRIRFFDTYRSYVINYNLGLDLVRQYVERHADTPEERWAVFAALLSSPRLPSGLTE